MPLLAGNHPLRGANNDSLGPRFPAVSDAYDEDLQARVISCAERLGLAQHMRPNATYCFVAGPAYESKAECRFLRSIGGDTVGMSTIPEVIVAKHAGMKILCLSLVTNKVVFAKQVDTVHASHQEVLTAVETSGKRVEALVTALISKEGLGSFLDAQPTLTYSPQKKRAALSSLGPGLGLGGLNSGAGVLLVAVAAAGLGFLLASSRR